MQIQIFTIPVTGGEEMVSELNRFLRANRVADIQKSVIQSSGSSFWTFCVSYLPMPGVSPVSVDGTVRKGKIDYREVLDEQTFARFCELRKIRKTVADSEAIPPFAVFTDAELAEIAKQESPTPQSLRTIPGIGAKKVEKYGESFCITNTETDTGEDEANGESD